MLDPSSKAIIIFFCCKKIIVTIEQHGIRQKTIVSHCSKHVEMDSIPHSSALLFALVTPTPFNLKARCSGVHFADSHLQMSNL